MTTIDALSRIESAGSAHELFPVDPAEAKKLFHEFGRLLHPDRVGKDLRADLAFRKVTNLYKELTNPPKAPEVKVGKWRVVRPLVKGSVADLYAVRAGDVEGVMKIVRDVRDNDLLKAEARSVKHLQGNPKSESDAFRRFLPSVLEGPFAASDRAAEVLSFAGDCHPLTYIHSQLTGVPFRHIAWMMNRVLSALGYCHANGVIHGAILPQHLLFRPADHGLQLVDWTASVSFPSDGHIPYRSQRWKNHYPPEVSRRDCYPSTDLFMAAKAMRWATDFVPSRFRDFFAWCTADSPSARPHDAWELQDLWKKLCEEEYGPPKFVTLDLPIN